MDQVVLRVKAEVSEGAFQFGARVMSEEASGPDTDDDARSSPRAA